MVEDATLRMSGGVPIPSSTNLNSGGAPELMVGSALYGSWDIERAVFRVDLSAIPAGATLVDARFEVFVTEVCHGADNDMPSDCSAFVGPVPYSLTWLRRPWVQGTRDYQAAGAGESNWLSAGAENWGAPGAGDCNTDRAQTVVATTYVAVGAANTWVGWDLTALVEAMVGGSQPNNGWIIGQDNAVGLMRPTGNALRHMFFCTSEPATSGLCTTAQNAPRLVVRYLP